MFFSDRVLVLVRTAELDTKLVENRSATEDRLLRHVNEIETKATAVETAINHRADDIDRLAKQE